MNRGQESLVDGFGFIFSHKNKANVSVADNGGATPLHYAACENYKEEMKLLLKSGANVNAVDHCGCTPLHLATQKGHEEIVKLLLPKRVDVNTPSTSFYNTNAEQFQAVVQARS